jgi:hypothetical protein
MFITDLFLQFLLNICVKVYNFIWKFATIMLSWADASFLS